MFFIFTISVYTFGLETLRRSSLLLALATSQACVTLLRRSRTLQLLLLGLRNAPATLLDAVAPASIATPNHVTDYVT